MTLLDDFRRSVYDEEATGGVRAPNRSRRLRRSLPPLPAVLATAPQDTHASSVLGPPLTSSKRGKRLPGKLEGLRTPLIESNQFERGGWASEPPPAVMPVEMPPPAAKIPDSVPLQLLQLTHVRLSRWSALVSDVDLRRVATHNTRLRSAAQRAIAFGSRSGSRQSHDDTKHTAVVMLGFESEDLEMSRGIPTRSVVANGADQLTDRGLIAIAEAVPTLEVLEIAGASNVTDAALRTLALNCTRLRRLNISNCLGIRGAGLSALAEACTELSELEIAGCAHIGGDWALLRCLYAFRRLERLNVAQCALVTDSVLQTLASQCGTYLRSLILTDCFNVSDAGVIDVATKCKNLEELALNRRAKSEKITDTSCAALGEHCSKLRVINLAGCRFLTDAALQWLAAGCGKSLEHLNLADDAQLTDASARFLGANCPQLQSIVLDNVANISDVGLRLLASGCPKLLDLQLRGLYLVSDGAARDFGIEGLRAVAASCSHLERLNIAGCFQLVERALVAVGAGCHALKKVNASACPNLSRSAIASLAQNCPRLTALNLSGARECDDRALAEIARCTRTLRKLRIADCERASDTGLRFLANSGCAHKLELLDFSRCSRISDDGIIALVDGFAQQKAEENDQAQGDHGFDRYRHTPALAHLLLAGCPKVTQDSVVRLAGSCPLLLTLSLKGCQVSSRLLKSLSFSWPLAVVRISADGSGDFGLFPAPRARDKRYVAEFSVLWTAALRIQNLYRARIAKQRAFEHKEQACRVKVALRLQSLWRARKSRRETLLRRAIQTGRDKAATKIQRRYKETRLARKAGKQHQTVLERELERHAIKVQRAFRTRRAVRVAQKVVISHRRQRVKENRAATAIQRRFRGNTARKRIAKLVREKKAQMQKELAAVTLIQTAIRRRIARKRVQELVQERLERKKQEWYAAVKMQSAWRRKQAFCEIRRRREEIAQRERAAVMLQSAYRARRARDSLQLLALAKYHATRDKSARTIQRRWRTRCDRVGRYLLAEMRRRRFEMQSRAAITLQHAFRRYLIRLGARKVVDALREQAKLGLDMERWAATLVQAHWRRRCAKRELARAQSDKRSRWKQLVDTWNQHGMGYGAPFYYNQVNGEIRRRMPRELLTIMPRPTCNQCEIPDSASVECATCCEYFCDQCERDVHGHGKRREHWRRKLFNFYGIRCDYGDGEFPSIWPSEMEQDIARGYDFVAMQPTNGYNNTLALIASFQPVVTGDWSEFDATHTASIMASVSEPVKDVDSSGVDDPMAHLFNEQDFDENGASLWDEFYDHAQGKNRYYHRVSKRVVDFPPSSWNTAEVGSIQVPWPGMQ